MYRRRTTIQPDRSILLLHDAPQKESTSLQRDIHRLHTRLDLVHHLRPSSLRPGICSHLSYNVLRALLFHLLGRDIGRFGGGFFFTAGFLAGVGHFVFEDLRKRNIQVSK